MKISCNVLEKVPQSIISVVISTDKQRDMTTRYNKKPTECANFNKSPVICNKFSK